MLNIFQEVVVVLIEGYTLDIRRPADSGLNTYCRLERMDCQYLTAGISKKGSPKAIPGSRKKSFTHRLFGF